MKRLSIFLAALAAGVPMSAHAIVDMGGAPGISDLYELEYNNNQLFPTDFDPSLDHDGDGISTLAEYRCFWSNPFDINDCGPKVQISRVSATTWEAAWPTRKGLLYQLESSPDLQTWTPLGSLVSGTGGTAIKGFAPGTSRLFFRLSSADGSLVDGDGNHLSAIEEELIGTSDATAVSDPISGLDDYFQAATFVLTALGVTPPAGGPTIEVGVPVIGLPRTQITEIPQAEALVKGGYFTAPVITDPENWDRFAAAGDWKPLSGSNLELQKGEDPQPWYGQWCELDAHWQNADRTDKTGPIAHGIEQTIPDVPTGRQLFLFFDYCRRYEGADSVKITAHTGDTATEVTLLTHTAPDDGWKRAMIPFRLPTPADGILSRPLCLRFDIGDGLDSFGIYVDNIELIIMEIVPDDNMAGVVGDVVKSALPGSTIKHFVTPKKSAEIAQDHVLLKAVGLDAARFAQRFAWVGGEPGDTTDKCKVARGTTGTTEVKITTKQGNVTAAQMDVWVVWAELTGRIEGDAPSEHNELVFDGVQNEIRQLGAHIGITESSTEVIGGGIVIFYQKRFMTGIEWRCSIAPTTIFDLSSEVPALDWVGPRTGVNIDADENFRASYTLWDVTRDKKLVYKEELGIEPQ